MKTWSDLPGSPKKPEPQLELLTHTSPTSSVRQRVGVSSLSIVRFTEGNKVVMGNDVSRGQGHTR